jgi:hypothetical protein
MSDSESSNGEDDTRLGKLAVRLPSLLCTSLTISARRPPSIQRRHVEARTASVPRYRARYNRDGLPLHRLDRRVYPLLLQLCAGHWSPACRAFAVRVLGHSLTSPIYTKPHCQQRPPLRHHLPLPHLDLQPTLRHITLHAPSPHPVELGNRQLHD